MKKLNRKFKLTARKTLLLTALGVALASNAQAATLDDVVAAINSLHDYIAGAVQSTMQTVNNLIYEPNPSLPATVVGNVNATNAKPTTMNVGDRNTLRTVQQVLTNKGDAQTRNLANIVASDTVAAGGGGMPNIFGSPDAPNLCQQGDENFSLNTLLSPLSYTGVDQCRANNFLQLASGSYDPVSADIKFDGLTKDQMSELQGTVTYQKYEAAVRAYVAAQSVGISNLNAMMAARMPQKDLGTAAGVVDNSGKPVADASQLQVANYLANRRVADKQWYEQMAGASPTTVSRETLFVLAEIRQQLYELQRQNERLLATMSVMEMQNAQLSKTNLQQLAQPVKGQIDKYKGKDSSKQNIQNLNLPQ